MIFTSFNIMRNTLLFSFFIFGLGATAQDYTPLLDELNEWQFTSCYFGCGTDIYYTDGDTIVNGKEYKILDGYHYINRNVLIREDVNEKKVFLTITQPQYAEDILLYDFSLEEGDSINMKNPLTPFPANAGYFMLDSIRLQQNENGNNNKYFYFTPTPNNSTYIESAKWIEGIGSISLINAPGGEPDINQVGELSCAFKNTELFYSNLDSISSCDPLLLNIDEIINSPIEIELLPQPERNHFLLTNATDVREVLVYGVNGMLYKNILSHNQTEFKLDLSDLETGIFILKLSLHHRKAETFKVVVK